ncbi:hypothetical protein Cgig2_021332 [Carnegiea gigantea]|uniref:Uncharacterized protein n=1 Tax=Carnegiea gigantea TaxID=171969 RepID=A0A9Q1Q5P6_9CARY|nr:hypothetical protein Cgig2_021332 [Carnegiea gigantea]
MPLSNRCGGRRENFVDDEENDEDLHNEDQHSQHSKIPDWNDNIEFDENKKVQIKAKNGDLCPNGEFGWHKVDKVYKADIVGLVRQKFVLPPNEIVDKKLLRCVGKAWRNHRYQLKRDHKKPGKTLQQVKDAMPGHLKLSNHGKEARASQDHYHTTGNKSFLMKRGELEKENGRKPGPLEFYIASHNRKDGSYKENLASKDFVETAETLIAERTTDSSSAKEVENEVFNELMYGSQSDQDKKHQRVVGYGMVVNYSKIFGVEGEIRKRGLMSRDNSTEEEVVKLKAEVSCLQSQLNAQTEQITN